MIRSGRVAFHDDLQGILYPIKEARPHPENNNEGDIDAIDHSVEENGMYGPIVVQKSTRYIVKGNHTWKTLLARDSEVCPMIWLDIDDATALRILYDDNHTARLARPDPSRTLDLLTLIKQGEETLARTSATEYDYDALQRLTETPLRYDEHNRWPVFSATVHPHVLRAFRRMTREADTDSDRFEVLLRLAGWDGS